MKKHFFFTSLIISFLLSSSLSFAIPFQLYIESYDPATFETKSTIIDIPDINDQLEISRQAVLFALSEEGWNLGESGSYHLVNYEDGWVGSFYELFVYVNPDDISGVDALSESFGYELNAEALTYGPMFGLVFHTGEWSARLSHDIGESLNNYGVISGCMGGMWHQCEVQNWGQFYIEEVSPVPEPATFFLLSLGLVGLIGVKKKWKCPKGAPD